MDFPNCTFGKTKRIFREEREWNKLPQICFEKIHIHLKDFCQPLCLFNAVLRHVKGCH